MSEEPLAKKARPIYNKFKKHVLECGLKGFMCTSNFSPKGSIREAYNLLNSYSDRKLKTEENKKPPTEDISEQLDNEIEHLKFDSNSDQRRFQVTDAGIKNLVFIKTTLADPVDIATEIANDILETKEQKTKDLLRLVPIETVCKTSVTSVKESIAPLLERHFGAEPKTFGVVFNRRFNNTVNRDSLISEIASMVTSLNKEHRVNLKNPDVTILVEIIKSWCLLSLLPDYNRLKKYNLFELSLNKKTESIVKTVDENKESST